MAGGKQRTDVKIDSGVVVHVTALCAVRRLRVTPNLDLENLQRGSIVGQEKVVQNVTALWLDIVHQQARGGTASREST